MERFETMVEDDVLFVEGRNGRIEVGEFDTVVDLLGGETYTVSYDERQRTVAWVDTDESGDFTFDVRETLLDITFDEEFVVNLAEAPYPDENEQGHPIRTAYFADMMTTIWDSKGNLSQ